MGLVVVAWWACRRSCTFPKNSLSGSRAEAARRHVTVEELAVELVSAGLGATGESALDAFIASGDSGDPTWAGRDIHELRSELATRRADETP
jgi:hypothetical protein